MITELVAVAASPTQPVGQVLIAGPPGASAYALAVLAGFVGTEAQWRASLVGPSGLSAFDLAVAAGFAGTEAQWRASLVGAPGRSAYAIAVAAGFAGTEAQWLASLVGAQGTTKARDLTDVPTPLKDVLTSADLPAARLALGLGEAATMSVAALIAAVRDAINGKEF